MKRLVALWRTMQRWVSDHWRSAYLKWRRRKTRFDRTRWGRTLARYSLYNGNVLAGGIAYYSLASIAAGLVIGATVTSLLAQAVPSLRERIFTFVGSLVPGIVGSDGLVKTDSSLVSPIAGLVGLFALLVLVNTATRFLGALRTGARTMLGRRSGNAFEAKARDISALAAIVLMVVLGLGLQVAGSRAATWIADNSDIAWVQTWVVRVPAVAVGLLVDMLFVAVALVVLGRVRAKGSRLWPVLLVSAIVVGILRQASSAVVASAVDNPVLGPFAAVVTLLAFVQLTTRVILYAAAWLGAGRVPTADAVVEDTGPFTVVDLSPARRRAKITTARATVRRRVRSTSEARGRRQAKPPGKASR